MYPSLAKTNRESQPATWPNAGVALRTIVL